MKVIKAEIEFTVGKTIRLDLYPELAPISVKNFVELAQSGYYEGLIFHRVIPAFMIQGGGFSYENGLRPANVISHEPGVISMARTSVKDSASSQFFICVADAKFLDGEYAAFGKVSDQASLDVAVSISRVKTHSEGPFDDIPDVPVVIKAVRITEGA